MNEQNKKRFFIALNLPQNVKDEISDLINKLGRQNIGALIKWVNFKNTHITLHFLSYLNMEQIKQAKLAMRCFHGKFGQLQFKPGKINVFPNLTSPRVIYLECKQSNSKSVFKLQELLGKKLIQLGLRVDRRQWKPHLTLGRVKEKCNVKIGDYEMQTKEFTVDSFELMESELRRTGAEHREVMSCKLLRDRSNKQITLNYKTRYALYKHENH